MRNIPSRFVVGYHGCDATLARRVLLGEAQLTPSNNSYDWLGQGIYFWEHGPARAFQFAREEARRSPKKISAPTVLGAYIYLGDCLDFLDVEFTDALAASYEKFMLEQIELRNPISENRGRRQDGTKAFHSLDRAVIEFTVDKCLKEGRRFDSVRGAFWEGGPAFPHSEISRKSHIQIAVRNPECIFGYFLPPISIGEQRMP